MNNFYKSDLWLTLWLNLEPLFYRPHFMSVFNICTICFVHSFFPQFHIQLVYKATPSEFKFQIVSGSVFKILFVIIYLLLGFLP